MLNTHALGILETTGFTPAIAALDVMQKASGVEVLQAELNDFLGVCLKLTGLVDAVETAIEEGNRVAEKMHGKPVSTVIRRFEQRAMMAIHSPPEFNPLIQQSVVHDPAPVKSESPMAPESPSQSLSSFALGLIETQGFTAVFEAIDSACKAANVEVVGKEKLGGGFVTVIIKGDVAAVNAAVEAGKAKVEGLGKLIAAHVIARPSAAVLSLLPKSPGA